MNSGLAAFSRVGRSLWSTLSHTAYLKALQDKFGSFRALLLMAAFLDCGTAEPCRHMYIFSRLQRRGICIYAQSNTNQGRRGSIRAPAPSTKQSCAPGNFWIAVAYLVSAWYAVCYTVVLHCLSACPILSAATGANVTEECRRSVWDRRDMKERSGDICLQTYLAGKVSHPGCNLRRKQQSWFLKLEL